MGTSLFFSFPEFFFLRILGKKKRGSYSLPYKERAMYTKTKLAILLLAS